MDARADLAETFLAALAGAGRITQSVLVLAAHPDDETVGLGGQFARFDRVVLALLTDGAPRRGEDARRAGFPNPSAYARARRAELRCALRAAGHQGAQVYELGFADQEASFHLVDAAEGVADLLQIVAPDVLITHPYEGGHPDHDAAAFAAAAACRLLDRRGLGAPALIEMASYHARGEDMVSGVFLPAERAVTTCVLTPEQRDSKARMIASHKSQQSVLAAFPLEIERFRAAPAYDFTAPPHAGPLHYERHDWGIDGARWRHNAAQALAEMELGPP
jgi:LmbE family N-acetylglucosaminyl deacetylase